MAVAALFQRMAEKKRCLRCDRPIDAAARICPYCNWDQSNPNVPRPEQTAAPVYVPRPERPWRRWIAIGIGGVLLVIIAFALGSHVIGSATAPTATTTDQSKTSTDTGPVRPAPHPEITLVPSTDTNGAAQPVEAPITSAPAATASSGAAPNEEQRTDATAASSEEYAQLAARAQAEKKKQQAIVDPRTLTAPAYQQPQQPKRQPPAPQQQQPQISSAPPEPAAPPATETRPPEQAAAAPAAPVRTPPQPEYQPAPEIQVNQPTTVRLTLTVGADGHVKEVDIGGQGIEGQTAKIIATVQTWRFKPATENGVPVPSTFSTALSFNGTQ